MDEITEDLRSILRNILDKMFKKNPKFEICLDRKKRKKLHILQTGDDLKIDVYELKCEKPLILTVDINRIDQ